MRLKLSQPALPNRHNSLKLTQHARRTARYNRLGYVEVQTRRIDPQAKLQSNDSFRVGRHIIHTAQSAWHALPVPGLDMAKLWAKYVAGDFA